MKKPLSKTALVSVWNHNYGSLLQTYAIQQYLLKANYDNEIIYYKENSVLKRILRFSNSAYTVSKFKIIIRQLYIKLFYKDIGGELEKRSNKFEQFKKDHLLFSNIIVGSNNLIDEIKNYDQVVLGSDQVLHPANLLMNYFNLNFVPSSMKKIGFAPSFGVSSIPENQKNRTKNYLKRFEHLSVREIAGKKIVKDLTGRDVPVVCDPTLLVKKKIWDDLIAEVPKKEVNYIFCYFLGENPKHRSFANELKKLTGFEIITLKYLDEFVKSDMDFGDISPFEVGPSEFVSLISNAEYVLTDSFHASIFSIIYHRKFFTFNRFAETKGKSTNSRISSLFKTLNLNNRLILGNENPSDLVKDEINYKNVENEINKIRDFSESFLITALQKQ
jgi:hypothetical protein